MFNSGLDICFYDVETTGRGRYDEVIQLAYILTDSNLGVKEVYNRYYMSNRPIDPGAQKKHGISREMLPVLSKEIYLEQDMRNHDVFVNKSNVIFTAYKDDFDRRLINQTLQNNTDLKIDFGERISVPSSARRVRRYNFCSYRYLIAELNNGHSQKLEQMANVQLKDKDLKGLYKVLCTIGKVPPTNAMAHDALYDCMLMWLLHSKLLKSRKLV